MSTGAGWQKRFFLIQDPGRLCYYEHEEDVELVDDAKWEVDIKARICSSIFQLHLVTSVTSLSRLMDGRLHVSLHNRT